MSVEPVIGIDLGTTYCAVATVRDGKPIIIPSRNGKRLTPSIVGIAPSGERRVGEAARPLLEESLDSVAFATKRFIGRRWTQELANAARALVPYPLIAGPSGDIRIKLAGRTLPLTQVSAMILGELKLDAEAYFGRPVSKAVITVPANFDDGQRSATKEAGTIAGLEVLRVVNEPTAAAVAYGLASNFQGRALVFDLGGGTFDVTILEVENGVFVVKATGGDAHLGGEDFDNRIVQWLLAQVPDAFREVVGKDKLSMQRLRTAAEQAKRALTERDEVLISVANLGDHASGSKRLVEVDTALTRSFFETLSEPLSRRCLEVCQRTMADAKLDPPSVDTVLLVGGMTRVPLVRKLVGDFFGRQPAASVNPDEVVALGAAVHANELSSREGRTLLLDVTANALGVGVAGGAIRWLIPRNAPVPAVAKEIFYPGQARQQTARIPIHQGSALEPARAAKLGEVVLTDLSTLDRTDVPIEVSFELNSEGILAVRAIDTTTGIAQAIRVQARTDLSPQEAERLRQEEEQHSHEKVLDAFQRLMGRGEKLLQVLEKSAEENPEPASTEAVEGVKRLLDRARGAQASQDMAEMREVSLALEKLAGSAR